MKKTLAILALTTASIVGASAGDDHPLNTGHTPKALDGVRQQYVVWEEQHEKTPEEVRREISILLLATVQSEEKKSADKALKQKLNEILGS